MKERYKKEENLKNDLKSSVDIVCDELTGKRYVSKTIWKDDNPVLVHQFHIEVDLLSSMHNAFVPELIDVFETESTFVLVETWIDGLALDQWITEHPVLIFFYRRKWILSVYRLLEEVHRLNYVYVDLKPQNLLIRNKEVYLIDFNSCIATEASQVMSASRFNFKEEKNQKDFGLDSYALQVLIRYLYPKNIGFKIPFSNQFKKVKMQYIIRATLQHCLYATLLVCLSLLLCRHFVGTQKNPLEIYLNSKKTSEFTRAYQYTKRKNNLDTLYIWIENGWLDNSLFTKEKISKKLLQEAIQSEDASICSYVVERIPKKQKIKMQELVFEAYQVMDFTPSTNWLEDYVSYISKKEDYTSLNTLINYLLHQQIVLSSQSFAKMGLLYTQNLSQINVSIACHYLEYGLFLKSNSVQDLSIPQCFQETYQNQEEWTSLYNIWRNVK